MLQYFLIGFLQMRVLHIKVDAIKKSMLTNITFTNLVRYLSYIFFCFD